MQTTGIRSVLTAIVLCMPLMVGAAVHADDQQRDGTDDKREKGAEPVYIHMKTSMGDIYLELNAELAPITVNNFVSYTENEFYDGTIFHRVIDGFMIQGGGFTRDMEQKPTEEPIKNEWRNGLKNERGTIAMARLGGRADSATSQFFINVSDNGFLDEPRDGAGYAVFGKVVHGMDVVDRIRQVPTTVRRGMQDVPVEPVVIERVRSISKEDLDKARAGDAGEGGS